MDFAELVMTANTKGLKDAPRDLDKIVDAGDKAERATKSQTDGMGRSYRSFGAIAGKALGGLVAGIGAYQIAASGLASARTFDAALAETSTLIDGTAAQMDYLDDKATQLARTFGTDATQQVQAFYQAISAGAASVEDAGDVLETANALAKGGLTEVSTAVGILSGVVNTYGADVINAEQVSDALFVGMRAGVTTIDQLSNSIGMVLPLANAMGLSFDEAVAATAALTKNNLSTSVAVTSLNAALTAISGPTSEAEKLAASLGLEFNSAALEAKGFGAFMADVSEKTGGSVDAMRTLFGSVEGMKAALLFAGEAGGQFADIMEDMGDKAGQTAIAVEKIENSLSDRFDTSLTQLGVLVMEFGNALLTVAVPALEGLVTVATFAADNLDVLAVSMTFLAATQIPAAVVALGTMAAGMTTLGGVAGVLTKAIGGLRVAMALLGGPIGIAVGLATAAGAAFLLMRDDTNEAETAMYDAKAGSEALNIALNDFANTGAPAAGKAAIDLANDNYKLADSAYEAAEAELAKARAMVQSIDDGSDGLARMQSDESRARLRREREAEQLAALERLTQAEADLAEARNGRDRATRTVTGSDFGGIAPVEGAGTSPFTEDDGEDGQGDQGGGRAGRGMTLGTSDFEDAARAADELAESQQRLMEQAKADEWNTINKNVSTLARGLVQAAQNGDNLGEALIQMLGQMATEWLIAALAAKAADVLSGGILSASMGAKGGGGMGGGVADLFGFAMGGKKNGGGVDPSKPHLVGEAGPELFQPLTFGTIIPNSQVGPATQRTAQQQQPAPNVNVNTPAPEVIVINDPRKIDEYRMSPDGEKARLRADRRLG